MIMSGRSIELTTHSKWLSALFQYNTSR